MTTYGTFTTPAPPGYTVHTTYDVATGAELGCRYDCVGTCDLNCTHTLKCGGARWEAPREQEYLLNSTWEQSAACPHGDGAHTCDYWTGSVPFEQIYTIPVIVATLAGDSTQLVNVDYSPYHGMQGDNTHYPVASWKSGAAAARVPVPSDCPPPKGKWRM